METLATMKSRLYAGTWMFTVIMLGLFAGPLQVQAQDGGDDQHEYIGVLGPIESLSDTEFTVLGVTFAVTADTKAGWEDGSGPEPAVGTTVAVQGHEGEGGVLYADYVDVENSDEGVGVRGSIDTVDEETVTVLGVSFARTDATIVGASAEDQMLGWGDLVPDLYVQVMGYEEDGTYYAAEIDLSVCWGDACPGDEVEIEGPIEALGDGALTVEGHTFIVTDETEIYGTEEDMIPFGDLAEGMLVHVYGAYGDEDQLYAYAISVRPDDATPHDPTEFVGVMGEVDAIDTDEISVLGVTFALDEHTRVVVMTKDNDGETGGVPSLEDGSLDDLAVGHYVHVMARSDENGALYAIEVVIAADTQQGVAVRGPVEAVDDQSITVLGVTFARTDTTLVGRPEAQLSWGDIQVDDYVEVVGIDGGESFFALFVGFDVCWEECGGGPHEITIEGRIEHVNGESLSVNGHQFMVTSETEIRGPMGDHLRLDELHEGLPVTVSGFEGEGGVLYATFIHVHPDGSTPARELVGVMGPIEAVDDTSVTVLGIRVLVSEHTYIVDEAVPHDAHDVELADVGDLQVGMVVGIAATVEEDALYAHEIYLNIEPERGADVAVRGPVEAVDDQSITVLGVTFARTDTTLVGRPEAQLSWGDIQVDDYVEVVGIDGGESFFALFVGFDVCWDECEPGEHDDPGVDVKGRVEALTDASLTVNGTTIGVTDETEVRGPRHDFTFADIEVGMFVWVVGHPTEEGMLQAHRIEVGVPQDRVIELFGAIQHLADSSLTVRGATFEVLPDTRIHDLEEQPIAYGDLAVGQLVKIDGAVGLDGELYAGRIWVGSEADVDMNEVVDENVEVLGVVQAVTDRMVTVRGHDFMLLPVTVIMEPGAAAQQPAGLQPGQMVKIHGRMGSDGVLYALRILIRPAHAEELSVKGSIDAVRADEIVVAGRPFGIGSATEIFDRWERAVTPGDLKPGMTVAVEAVKQGDVWEARSIRVYRRQGMEVELVVSIDAVDQPNRHITVLGHELPVHPEALIVDHENQPIDFSRLEAGRFVKLRVLVRPDGMLFVPRIKLLANDASGDLVIGGVIEALYPDSLEVAGLPIEIDAGTEILDRAGNALSIEDLVQGQQVVVDVQAQSGGTFLALRIKRKSVVEVAGSVGDFAEGTLSVQGTTFIVDENTLFLDAMNRPIDPLEVESGHIVEVFGEQSDPEAPESKRQGMTTASAEATLATRVTVLNYESDASSTAIEAEPATKPTAFVLRQNYPNPFNPTTTIAFELANAQPEAVRLIVYNVLGQEVRRLVDGTMAAGQYEVVWDARDSAGAPVASGVYLYRLQVGNVVKTNTMVLMK